MKNNTKLIMETWRRFLNEDSSDPDLDSGFSDDDDSMPSGQSGSEDDYFDDIAQGVDDRDSLNGIDEPIDGEPPFDSEEPVAPQDDFVDLPYEGDDIEYSDIGYSREDARMSPEQRDKAQAEREEEGDDYRSDDFYDYDFDPMDD